MTLAAREKSGGGYWQLKLAGAVFSFGDAQYHGAIYSFGAAQYHGGVNAL